MPFELEPDNRGAGDDVLLDDLRRVASTLAKQSVSRDEYERNGRFHPKTLVKRFGSWNASLLRAGLLLRKAHLVTEAEFLEDLRRVAARVGGSTLSVEQYCEYGRYSTKPVSRLFGDWESALSRVSLKPGLGYNRTLTEQEMFENLATVWRSLGRQPKQSDMRKPLSVVGHDAYVRRYGGWREALERFVAFMNRDAQHLQVAPEASALSDAPASAPTQEAIGSKARTAGWRLRFLVMRRDSFRCCQCGASPATSPGTVLAVDHIVPWCQGGATVIENLQTLCEPCNGGKSALPASAD